MERGAGACAGRPRDALNVLLLAESMLNERRRAARGPLAPLFDSLAAELAPLVGSIPEVPRIKALLSRAGGRCEVDGAALAFDPTSPHAHRCPRCERIHRGEYHDRAWVTSYQLWLAERAVHAALFYVLRGQPEHAALAREILRAYADCYLGFPNSDNVLGPTRLFFSTYLESIWLLQICIAADLVERAGDGATADMVRDRIVEPSSTLIAGYDEGMSNRQVWNNAALLAAAGLARRSDLVDGALSGPSGLSAHLGHGLLADGTWYEGENYHQFALRGLWYGVTMCEARDVPVDAALLSRFDRAFAAPYLTALPDFTLPARKDSQYGTSLRQWRFAELAELGLARRRDPILAGALARCYDGGLPRRETGRARSTADIERNGPPTALTRADLGWRALLHALPELPPLTPRDPRSVLLEGQGVAVFRRAEGVYVAVEFGQAGGGHGHPDRLNLLLSQAETRWLDDLGTGSYVDPSLHWYRSTLAHNAPLVDGRSQPPRHGTLLAYEERDALGWIVAAVDLPDGVRIERCIVVTPDYVVDELRWSAPNAVDVDLPWHLSAEPMGLVLHPAALPGGQGLEDGFSFATDTRALPVAAGADITLLARSEQRTLRAWLAATVDVTLYSACGPGQPPASTRRFYVLRARGSGGAFRAVLGWSDQMTAARIGRQETVVELSDGARHVHRRDQRGWHAELFSAGARSSIDLAGWRPPVPVTPAIPTPAPAPAVPRVVRRHAGVGEWYSDVPPSGRGTFSVFELGESHYRRSESAWREAGAPRATVAVGADAWNLIVHLVVHTAENRFMEAGSDNPFDTEHADTLGSGVQLYMRAPEASRAWMLVPEGVGPEVRARPLAGGHVGDAPRARWRPRSGGYEMRIELSFPATTPERPVDLDILINETTRDRSRRRGQLVLSGARNEFVYLRGDRHDPARLLPFVVVA